MRTQDDRDTFSDYCGAIGLSPVQHLAASRREDDLVPQPAGDPVVVRRTPYGDNGVYCTRFHRKGEFICLVVTRQKQRTAIAGRFINHSANPSTAFGYTIGGIVLCARRAVCDGDELTVDYRMISQIDWGVYETSD